MATPARYEQPTAAQRIREERTLGRAGLLAALAPLAVPALTHIAEQAARETGYDALIGVLPLAAVIAMLLVDAALVLARDPQLGRRLLTIGALSFAALATVGLRGHPAKALALLLAVLLFSAWTANAPEAGEPGHTLRGSRTARARMAAVGTVLAGFFMVGFRLTEQPQALVYPLLSLAITLGLTLRALAEGRPGGVGLWTGLAAVLVGTGTLSLAVLLGVHADLTVFALLPIAAGLRLILRRPLRGSEEAANSGWRELFLEQPARLLVGTFLLAGLGGAVILTLPVCAGAGFEAPRVMLLDAAFTAFSAVCVTGLAVLDTATDYSTVGQGVILVLIQIGGLGILTFSTAAVVVLGQRLSLREEGVALELLGGDRRSGLDAALRRMLVVTAICEGIGAIALTVLFRVHGDGWLEAGWRGLFTSVSAFCNAGFAIQSDSLIGYRTSPAVLNVVAALIIAGGLGPVVVAALPRLLRTRRRPSLQVRIALLTALVLLVAPTFLIAALEWNHSLAELGYAARFNNAWFQSVTTRTAGFNSVDFAAMTPATQTLVEALMFIGGSPGSTAGGVKTSTVFVLVLAVAAVTRQQSTVVWGGWQIPHTTIYRAAAVVTLGMLSVLFAVFAIQLTQALDTRTALFEVVSALGTVGLSIGGTAQLDSVGKLIIIVCMFMGRVAPLTLFLIFNRPASDEGSWSFPEQDVTVG